MTEPSAERPEGEQGHGLDVATSWVERPVRRITGSDRFNPLPHAGTISVFLLAVVVGTGLYLTLFYQYGFDASYESVAAMEAHPIQRIFRALHRYSSAALVVTSVVHAWRIFVAGRFTPRARRWRWVTGWAMLLVVWPAGVTGYLLVWDERAGVIAEAIGRLLAPFGVGAAWTLRFVSGQGSSTGSTFMVVVWFVHLGLTVIVGWFAYRHLRRNRLAWYPPRLWAALMGGSLFLSAVFLPVGMLGPADPTRIGFNLPLDPFVLFMLPILQSSWRWPALVTLALLTGLGMALPFLLRRRSVPAPVEVHADECTGCNLCVVDCPYEALSLVERSSADDPSARPLAVVDAGACVSCGICLGSCAFGALSLPSADGRATALGAAAAEGADPNGPVAATVVVACDRHEGLDFSQLSLPEGAGGDVEVRYVGCAGAVGPDLIRSLSRRGAATVEVVGCAAGDCRFGLGNTLAAERIHGDRAPHLPRGLQSSVVERYGAPGDLIHGEAALAAPDVEENRSRRSLIGAGAVVLTSAVVVAVATAAPYRAASEEAEVRVLVDQEPGAELEGVGVTAAAITSVELSVDGEPVGTGSVSSWQGRRVAAVDWSVDPGPADVEVSATTADGEVVVVYADRVDLTANQRLQVPVRSVPAAPGVAEGKAVFESRAAGCTVCHSVEPGDGGVGPSLYGVADRAGSRVEGLNAEQYLWQSILLPDQYVVDGYPAGQMLPIYRERLSQDELDAVVAYLMTLTADDAEGGDS